MEILKKLPGLAHEIDRDTVFELFCRDQCNTFGIWSNHNVMYGMGMYPAASFFNHSCSPNLVHIRRGTTLEVRTLTSIPAEHTTLCISYCELTEDTRQERADYMYNFAFDCNCPRCASDDSHEEWMKVERFCCKRGRCTGTRALIVSKDKDGKVVKKYRCSVCGKEDELTEAEQVIERCPCGRDIPLKI